MKFALNEVKFAKAWEAEEHGTLLEGFEKGDNLKLAKIKPDKQVVLMITEKGETAPNKQIVCSKPLSAVIKAAVAQKVEMKKILKSLMSLNVITNDTGTFLVMPAGQIGESFTFEEINKVKEVVNIDQLVVLGE